MIKTCSGYSHEGVTVFPHDLEWPGYEWATWANDPKRAVPGRIIRCKQCDYFRKSKYPPSIHTGLPISVNGHLYYDGVEVDSIGDHVSAAPPPPPPPARLDSYEAAKEEFRKGFITRDELLSYRPQATEQYDEPIGPKPYRPPRPKLASLEQLAGSIAAVATPTAPPKRTRARKTAVTEDQEEVAKAPEYEYVASEDLIALWRALVDSTVNGGMEPPNLIFFGPSGSGKTRAAKHLAELINLPFTKVDAASHPDPESWFGTREVIVEQGQSVTKYVPSALVEALQRAGVVFVDEMNRVDDEHRNVWLPLTDGTGFVTNPLTGEVIQRHPHCFIIMAGNRGMQFTGTSAVDPAFTSRSYIVEFEYLDEETERRIIQEATGCDPDTAYVFAKFAWETRQKALGSLDGDFPTVSTREAIMAARAVARGLSRDLAAKYAVMNASSADGGQSSVRQELENIWAGVRITRAELEDEEDDVGDAGVADGWTCPKHGKFKVVKAGVSKAGAPYDAFRSCPESFCEEAEPMKPKHGAKTCTSCQTVNPPGRNSFCVDCGAVLP